MKKITSIVFAAALAFFSISAAAKTLYTTTSVSDELNGTYSLSSTAANIGILDLHGIAAGVGADVIIDIAGRYSGSGATPPSYSSGAAALVFDGSGGALANIGSINAASISAVATYGNGIGLYFNNASQAKGASINTNISAAGYSASNNNTGTSYGIYVYNSTIGKINGVIESVVTGSSNKTIAYGIYIADAASVIGDIGAKVTATNSNSYYLGPYVNAYGIWIADNNKSGFNILKTAEIKAVYDYEHNDDKQGSGLYAIKGGEGVVIGDIAGKVTTTTLSHSTAYMSLWGISLGNNSSIGNISGSIETKLGGYANENMALQMGENSKIGNITGSITTSGGGDRARGITMGANSEIGDVSGTITMTNAGSATGISMGASGSIGKFSGEINLTGRGNTIGGVTGISLGADTTIEEISGSIYVKATTTANYANGIGMGGVLNLKGNASIVAEAARDSYAFAINTVRFIEINGDENQQLLKGNLNVRGGLKFNAGNYLMDNFATSSTWNATGNTIEIAKAANVEILTDVTATATQMNWDGAIIFHANTVSDFTQLSMGSTMLDIGAESIMNVILDSEFTAFYGNYMDIAVASSNGLIAGEVFDYDLIFENGHVVDENLYEVIYAANGRYVRIQFVGDVFEVPVPDIPEPAEMAALIALLAFGFIAYRRNK